jgi:hypothetical protein
MTQKDASRFQSSPLQSAAQLGAAAMQASIAFWWRWPALMAGAMPARDPAEKDRQARDKAATANVVAAQIEAMRNLAESINSAPARAPAQLKPARRNAKAKPQSKRRHKR